MTTPTYDNIFTQYYRLYRAEATVPVSTDDEYVIGLSLANEAIARWANYDGTYWKQLFTTAQTNSTGGIVTITTGTKTYAAPTAMAEAGGFVKVIDSSGGTLRTYPILEPQDAQFRDDAATYAYFTGDPGNGFTLHLNPAPDASINGKSIDYVYYKKPTELTTGSSKTECPVVEFIVHRMLANRFRASRNPYYASAKVDAEDALKTIQANNNSGNWADPWKLADNSGTTWGQGAGSATGFF